MQSSIRRWSLTAAFLLTAVGGGARAQDAAPADVTLGGEVVLRLRATAGGYTPQQRVGVIEERLTRTLAVPGIKPSDTVVYSAPGKPPVIYVLGRRLITVDASTVKAAGGGTAMELATQWAKRLQQLLPRVNYRPSNAPEPVIPANPPLLVTDDLSKIGGTGSVVLSGKIVARLAPQPGSKTTATERADLIGDRLERIVAVRQAKSALQSADIQAVAPPGAKPAELKTPDPKMPEAKKTAKPQTSTPTPNMPTPPPPAQVTIGQTIALTASADDAAAAKMPSPAVLANVWAKNIRAALGLPVVPSPAAPAAPPVSPPPAPAGEGTGR